MEAVVAVRQGIAFPPRYVEILRQQVLEHIGVSLITLTDQEDTPGDTLPLLTPLNGWWSKLELFAPWNAGIRPCLYLDLDTFILKDIRDIAHDPGDKLLMLRDFFNENNPASGVMVIPRETEVWDRWNGDTSLGNGDQAFIGRFCEGFLQDRYEGIVSYKVDLLPHPERIEKARVCCFHGHPKPHETEHRHLNEWAKGIWNGVDRRAPASRAEVP